MICFLHFNKAAGSTLVEIARRNCRVYTSIIPAVPVRLSRSEEGHTFWEVDDWWNLPPRKLDMFLDNPGCDFIAIEFGPEDEPHNAIASFSPKLDYVSILRHPITMLCSRYLHMSGAGLLDGVSIDKWILTDPRANPITSVLSSNWKEPDLEKAKKSLHNLKALMFVETLESDIKVMDKKFGWKDLNLELYRSGTRNNANPKELLTASVLKEVNKRNSLDIKLWKYAKSIKDKINN